MIMNSNKWVEVSVGFLMLLGIVALVFLAIQVSGLSVKNWTHNDYTVSATFSNIGNLKIRAPVRIAGVEVGNVIAIRLDPKSFEALVTFTIDNKADNVPLNSTAAITSSGLLGDNFLSISPGFYEDSEHPENLQEGSVITTTYSATSIESLISAFMSSAEGKKS